MAFNWQTFRTRALTAIVFVVVMMTGLLWNRWSFFVLFSIVHAGCWLEYFKLVAQFYPGYRKVSSLHKGALVVAGWCFLLFFTNDMLAIGTVHLSQVGLWLGIALLILIPVTDLIRNGLTIPNLGYSASGLLYISLSLALLIDLRNRWTEGAYQLSVSVPLLVIFSLWINDTMAYIVGSLIGKTPLSPVSPKKTWEGTAGGVILTIITMSSIAFFTGRLPVVHAAIMSGIAAVVGTIGDLFESKLKRMAGVKDSGNIMPGHGGFLDRFDSLLFASTAVWLYAVIFLG